MTQKPRNRSSLPKSEASLTNSLVSASGYKRLSGGGAIHGSSTPDSGSQSQNVGFL
jgi:hypothetical protein